MRKKDYVSTQSISIHSPSPKHQKDNNKTLLQLINTKKTKKNTKKHTKRRTRLVIDDSLSVSQQEHQEEDTPPKTKNTSRWTEQDTKRFYTGMKLFGIDFQMIQKLISAKTREQIKSKYHNEMKVNPGKIHLYLQKHNQGRLIKLMSGLKEMNKEQSLDDMKKMVRRRYSSFLTIESTDLNVVNELYEDFKMK